MDLESLAKMALPLGNGSGPVEVQPLATVNLPAVSWGFLCYENGVIEMSLVTAPLPLVKIAIPMDRNGLEQLINGATQTLGKLLEIENGKTTDPNL